MSTTAERRALLLLTVLICLGVAARVARQAVGRQLPAPPHQAALEMQIARVESARAARRLVPRAATRARGATERSTSPRSRDQAHTKKPDVSRPIDLDVASAKEIERLPYIGEALAIRITSDRDSCGSFGSLDGLKRVYGIGDGMARRLAPLVTFSGPSRPMGAAWPPGCARADKSAALRRRGRS